MLKLAATTAVKGQSVQAQLILASPAPGSLKINLATSSAHVTVPASVSFSKGAKSVAFTVSVKSSLPKAQQVAIKAGNGDAAILEARMSKPTPPALVSVAVSGSTTIRPKEIRTGTVTISAPAPDSGFMVALSVPSVGTAEQLVAVSPLTLAIRPGQKSATIQLIGVNRPADWPPLPAGTIQVKVTARSNGVEKSTTLNYSL